MKKQILLILLFVILLVVGIRLKEQVTRGQVVVPPPPPALQAANYTFTHDAMLTYPNGAGSINVSVHREGKSETVPVLLTSAQVAAIQADPQVLDGILAEAAARVIVRVYGVQPPPATLSVPTVNFNAQTIQGHINTLQGQGVDK
jgi:hypothetical protein